MKNIHYQFIITFVFISYGIFANGNFGNILPGTQRLQQSNGLHFTPNLGQVADRNGKLCPNILYVGDGGGANIYLRTTGISYVYSDIGEVVHNIDEQIEELVKTGIINETDQQKKKDELFLDKKIKIHRIDMDFEGCLPVNAKAQIGEHDPSLTNADEVEGYTNYYYAHCPQGITNVTQYNKVTYKNIYNGIDVKYYSSAMLGTESAKQGGLKYDLIVQPHADPSQIKLHWTGAESILINRAGHLVIKSELNELTETIPKVFQIINGKPVDVKAHYSLTYGDGRGEDIVTFKLSNYQTDFPLVIDPWATYYGGADVDFPSGVACDAANNVFMGGATTSPAGIASIAPIIGFQTIIIGTSYDAFLVKFNSSTGARVWATYYGGVGNDIGSSVACDNTGNVYMAGRTSSNSGIASTTGINGFQTVRGGGTYDAFLVKFNSTTGTRVWATYYGGTNEDWGNGVACDNAGNVYMSGSTESLGGIASFSPTLGFKFVYGGFTDGFLVKFNSTTGARSWGTYYGDGGYDWGIGVACDNTDNVFLVGHTRSPIGLSSTSGIIGFQPTFGGTGNTDAYLVKFNSTTCTRVWATYYGNTGIDYGYSVACDNLGNVYMSGFTNSLTSIASTSGIIGFQPVLGGSFDAFLVQFNSATGARTWGTYIGTNLSETTYSNCLTIDGSNNVYMVMEVEDKNSPFLHDACSYQPADAGGGEEQQIIKFNPTGNKVCATYYGGPGYEDLDLSKGGGGIAISGNLIFICAMNENGGYPVTSGAHQTVHGGGRDAVLASLCVNICEGKSSLGLNFTTSTSVCVKTPIKFIPSISNSCDTTGYKYFWVFAGGIPSTSSSMTPTVTFSGVGPHDVKLVVTTLCKKDSVEKANFISSTLLTGQFTKGTANCSSCGCKEWIIVNAIGGVGPYTYLWPGGYDKRYQNKLCPGSYSINIKDKNGCSTNVNLTAP